MARFQTQGDLPFVAPSDAGWDQLRWPAVGDELLAAFDFFNYGAPPCSADFPPGFYPA